MRRCRGIMAGRSYEKYDQNSKKNLPKDKVVKYSLSLGVQ